MSSIEPMSQVYEIIYGRQYVRLASAPVVSGLRAVTFIELAVTRPRSYRFGCASLTAECLPILSAVLLVNCDIAPLGLLLRILPFFFVF